MSKHKRAGNKQHLPPSAGGNALETILEIERQALERLLELAQPQSMDNLTAQAEAILEADRLRIEQVLKQSALSVDWPAIEAHWPVIEAHWPAADLGWPDNKN